MMKRRDGSKSCSKQASLREIRARERSNESRLRSFLSRKQACAHPFLTNVARGQAARGGESKGHLGRVRKGARGVSAGG
jgi:hypothetical protein